MKNKLLTIILLSLTLKTFALGSMMVKLKCENGTYPGKTNIWKNLTEFYPNGFISIIG